MKQVVLISAIAISLFQFSCQKKELADPSRTGVEDVYDKSTFEQRIAQGASLVFFHAVWCTKCAAQRPAFEMTSQDAELSFANFYEVDYEENKEIVDKYNISGFPTIVLYVDGEEENRFEGTGHTQEQLTNEVKLYK
jgi:thiol-disulfide isomerase/thioredoxin